MGRRNSVPESRDLQNLNFVTQPLCIFGGRWKTQCCEVENSVCLGFGGGGLQFPMHASIDLSRYILYVEEFLIGHKLSFLWPDINTHWPKKHCDFKSTASTYSYNFDEVCEYSYNFRQKLVFPVPNFKIPRMLYGLFYMQYIAKPQGLSQNNAIRYTSKAILLLLFRYWLIICSFHNQRKIFTNLTSS